MARIQMIFSVILLGLIVSSCAKYKARKTLVGTWDITGFYGDFYNTCADTTSYEYNYGEDFGTIEFTKKEFYIEFRLFGDSTDCYSAVSTDLSGNYKVTEHDRKLILIHEYQVELNGDSWFVYFDHNEKADGSQNNLTMASYDIINTLFPINENMVLELTRDN